MSIVGFVTAGLMCVIGLIGSRRGHRLVASVKQGMTHPLTDISVIADIRQRFEASENSGDMDATAELLADDAVLLVPDYPVQEGKPACVAFLCEVSGWLLATFNRHITYVSTEVAIVGDLAFDRGTFAFDVSRKSGGPVTHVTGKYFWLLRRDLGRALEDVSRHRDSRRRTRIGRG